MNDFYFCVGGIGKNDVNIGFTVFGYRVVTRLIGFYIIGFGYNGLKIVVENFQIKILSFRDEVCGLGSSLLVAFEVLPNPSF